MNKIEAIVRPEKLEPIKEALAEAGFNGLNAIHVTGRGVQRGVVSTSRGGGTITVDMLPKVKIEIVVATKDSEKVIGIILQVARTGNIGDGKIFITPVAEVIRVRTGERGEAAL